MRLLVVEGRRLLVVEGRRLLVAAEGRRVEVQDNSKRRCGRVQVKNDGERRPESTEARKPEFLDGSKDAQTPDLRAFEEGMEAPTPSPDSRHLRTSGTGRKEAGRRDVTQKLQPWLCAATSARVEEPSSAAAETERRTPRPSTTPKWRSGPAPPRRRRHAHRWRLFGDWRKEVEERLRRLHSILFAADTALERGDAAAAQALVLRLLGFQALTAGAGPDDAVFVAPIRATATARLAAASRARAPRQRTTKMGISGSSLIWME